MTNDEIRMTKEDPNDECSKHHTCREIGRNLASTPNWRLEAAIIPPQRDWEACRYTVAAGLLACQSARLPAA